MDNTQLTCTWVSVLDATGREHVEAVWTARPTAAGASQAA